MGTARWLALAVALVVLPMAAAQEVRLPEVPAPPPSAAESPLDQAYRLMVGDQIKVVVDENPQYDQEYTVPANGEVSFPHIGKLNLKDRTITEIEGELIQRFVEKEIFAEAKPPRVWVLILAYAPRQISMIGAVSRTIQLYPHKQFTILEVMAMAGVNELVGDLRNVKVFRKDPQGKIYPFPVNVEKIINENDFEANILVKPDDMIVIPSIQAVSNMASVYLLGKVNRPNRYTWIPGREQMTLLQVLSLAGDFSQFADQSEIRILRKSGGRTQAIDVDFDDIIENKVPDVVLEPNDVVYVPESPW